MEDDIDTEDPEADTDVNDDDHDDAVVGSIQ